MSMSGRVVWRMPFDTPPSVPIDLLEYLTGNPRDIPSVPLKISSHPAFPSPRPPRLVPGHVTTHIIPARIFATPSVNTDDVPSLSPYHPLMRPLREKLDTRHEPLPSAPS